MKEKVLAACAAVMLFALPIFGQARTRDVNDVSESKIAAPAWAMMARDSALRMPLACNNDRLISDLSTATLVVGCDVPAGSLLIAQVGDGISSAHRVTENIPAGDAIAWQLPADFPFGGTTFFVSVVPTNAPARNLLTAFGTPEQLRVSLENFATAALFHGGRLPHGPCAPRPPLPVTDPPGPFMVAVNYAVPDMTIAPGTTNAMVGSYTLTASGTPTLSLIAVLPSLQTLGNLRPMINGRAFGSTQPTVVTGKIYAFLGNIPFSNGMTAPNDLYGDVLPGSSGVYAPATTITGIGTFNAAGQIVGTPVGVAGQNVNVAGTPPATKLYINGLTVSNSVPLGSTGNTVLSFYASNPSAQAIVINSFMITDTTTSPGFLNLLLREITYTVGGSLAMTPVSGGAQAVITLNQPMYILPGTALALWMTADATGNMPVGSTHCFSVVAVDAKTVSGAPIALDTSRAYAGTITVTAPVR